MTKSNKTFIGILLVTLAFLASSCRYEEGPGLSIHKPEYRIIGTWQLSHCYLNGTEIDTTSYHANAPETYYYIYADYVLNVLTYYNGDIRQSTFGTWYLTNKDTQLVLDFTLLGKKYSYIADIKKLSRKELFYEYDDEDGNHWRLEMNSRSYY